MTYDPCHARQLPGTLKARKTFEGNTHGSFTICWLWTVIFDWLEWLVLIVRTFNSEKFIHRWKYPVGEIGSGNSIRFGTKPDEVDVSGEFFFFWEQGIHLPNLIARLFFPEKWFSFNFSQKSDFHSIFLLSDVEGHLMCFGMDSMCRVDTYKIKNLDILGP